MNTRGMRFPNLKAQNNPGRVDMLLKLISYYVFDLYKKEINI